MDDDRFKTIDERYTEFQNHLMKNGFLPYRDTGIGIWGVTPHNETFELFKRISLDKHRSFVDLGSGDGRIVLTAALFGLSEAKGIEFDPWLVNTSLHMKRKLGLNKNVSFIEDDFHNHHIGGHDVVFVSPDRPFYRGLEDKMKKELSGKLIVHGWEFQPQSLKKTDEHVIDGEKFCIYEQKL